MTTWANRASEPLGDAAQSADYIADLTRELAEMARSSGLDMLAYLLDIAHLEASEQAGRPPEAAHQLVRPGG